MTTTNHAAPTALDGEIGAILSDFTTGYQDLLRLTRAHRAAVRAADAHELRRCLDEHTVVLQRLADAEERRQRLVNREAGDAATAATRATTLSDLARRVHEPARSALLAAADNLRELIRSVHAEGCTLRAAARSLVAHMEGLIRQVGRTLSHAGTYSPRGIVEPAAVLSALDLRS